MPNVTIQGPMDLRQIIIRRPEMFLRDPDGINASASTILIPSVPNSSSKRSL